MKESGQPVAIVFAGPWLPDASGEELLERVHTIHPHAKRALLIGWGDWADEPTAQAIRRAMGLGHIDYYVIKPWSSPDELFHRYVTEFLQEWTRANAPGRREITVVADPWSPRGYELRNLLARNGVPHAFHACSSAEGTRLLSEQGREGKPEPIVVLLDGEVLVDPTNADLAAPRLPRHDRAQRPGRVRRRDRGRRPGGARRRGVRVVGGTARARGRARVDRRPVRVERQNQELPGLPAGHLGRRVRPALVPAGLGLRHRVPAHAPGRRAALRERDALREDPRRLRDRGEERRARDGRRVPPPRPARARGARGERHLLRLLDLGRDAVHRQAGVRGRGRELGGSGGGAPEPVRGPRPRPLPRRQPRHEHVAVPAERDRGPREHRRAARDDRRRLLGRRVARGDRAPRPRAASGRGSRRTRSSSSSARRRTPTGCRTRSIATSAASSSPAAASTCSRRPHQASSRSATFGRAR